MTLEFAHQDKNRALSLDEYLALCSKQGRKPEAQVLDAFIKRKGEKILMEDSDSTITTTTWIKSNNT